MPRVIFNGEAGDAWTNDTGKVQYQFHASLVNTCGACLQYHMAISAYWPIPLHRGCNCTQTIVEPDATAAPWVDFRALLDGMDERQKRAAVGASNYKLVASGVVTWADVVTNARVRTLREVVAREKLTIKAMVDAGVKEGVARDAYASVHTSAHVAAARRRRALVANLLDAGLSPQQVKQRFARRIAERVGLANVHGGGAASPTFGPAIEPLVVLLGLDAAKVRAAMAPKPEPKPKPKEEDERQ